MNWIGHIVEAESAKSFLLKTVTVGSSLEHLGFKPNGSYGWAYGVTDASGAQWRIAVTHNQENKLYLVSCSVVYTSEFVEPSDQNKRVLKEVPDDDRMELLATVKAALAVIAEGDPDAFYHRFDELKWFVNRLD